MTAADATSQIGRQREQTTARQARAADPLSSVWVSANAGTGKTHVLTNRVLRLMLAGTSPERLLCLTYTKAAAAEMSERVFNRLAQWVTADDTKLAGELALLLMRPPIDDELRRARDLFTAAIETPGGLKIQTIHAFCERLLQRFPLEAGVPPGFEILDDELKAELLGQAIEAMLRDASSKPETAQGRALAEVIAWAHDDSFANVIGQALARRDWLEVASRLEFGKARGLDAAGALYRRALGLRPSDNRADIDAAMGKVLSRAMMTRARDVLRSGGATDAKRASELSTALGARHDGARIEALTSFFLTDKGSARASLMTAALKKANDDLEAALRTAQAQFEQLSETRQRVAVGEATIALMHLAYAIQQRFHDLKQARAALDFDDLIRAAGSLLRLGDDAQWVLYKLDGGLDHILVDEAQDTSRSQWQVIDALAREFFSGAGARESDGGMQRTVFAVGDEKQSIYGFQGAAPKMFAEMGRKLEGMALAAEQPFDRVPLSLSFRTVAPILDCVDRIFGDDERAKGLTSDGSYHPHDIDRLGAGGLVELWETEKPDETESASPWLPLEEVATTSPVARLAERIAAQIASWIASGERLASEDRPITAGDILILVRKRRPFADEMVSALKARGIPVAGADRLRLADQIAVKDIIALGDVLLLPEDDLSLAAVLKSPMFGLDDDDLMAVAPARRGSLWSALIARTRNAPHPRLSPAVELLKRWRTRADVVPPYEFLVEVLMHDGMRRRLLSRLGPEAADPLDELMSLALTYDDQAPPSLQGFIDWLKSSEREIKRDMEHGRNEVRVMTVHGSKGLEAPIVFLPDTCSPPFSNRPGGLIDFPALPQPGEEHAPFLWPVKGSSGLDSVKSARDEVRVRETEEHNRLLYVALTRARDRLYVAGFEGSKGRAAGCWYETIEAGFSTTAFVTEVDALGHQVRRIGSPQSAPPKSRKHDLATAVEAETPPDWAARPAPTEAGLSFPLAPSRLAPLEIDGEGDPVNRAPGDVERIADGPPAPSPRVLADGNRFLRGTITHALLQHLPGLPKAAWREAAERFIAIRGAGLRPASRASILKETLHVLSDGAFAAVFGPESRAEVPIAAAIPHPDQKSPPLRLAGQIDRIVISTHEILIVDFKTNRPPPFDPAQVADAYVLQLAAYRMAVAQAFPGRQVRAALLWTDGPSLMELPPDRLDNAASALFTRAAPHLDA